MKASIAICTWNRAALLEQTLAGMSRMQRPEGVEWELLVVNNRCTDSTSAVVSSFNGSLPIREVLEPNPGLSNARNAAIEASEAEHIVFTDDDVLVDEGWLCGYLNAFRRHPEAAFFGGPILPWFERDPPQWLRESIQFTEPTYGIRDYGDKAFALDLNHLPYGANMAFRRAAIGPVRFDPRLGRLGKGMLAGEELKFLSDIIEQGGQGWWVPEAGVRHFVPKQCQTLTYIRRYWFGNGYSEEIAQPAIGRWPIAGRPAWLWKDAILGELEYWMSRMVGRPDLYVPALRRSAGSWGRITAGFREARKERAGAEPK